MYPDLLSGGSDMSGSRPVHRTDERPEFARSRLGLPHNNAVLALLRACTGYHPVALRPGRTTLAGALLTGRRRRPVLPAMAIPSPPARTFPVAVGDDGRSGPPVLRSLKRAPGTRPIRSSGFRSRASSTSL